MATIGNVLVDNAAIYIESPADDGDDFNLAGYTEEGAEFVYEPDVTMIDVHEETTPINAILGAEVNKFNIVFAEADLALIDVCLTGSSLTSDTITLGGGVVIFHRIKLVTDDPDNAGKFRKIEIYNAVQTGNVPMMHKRDEKMTLSVEFQAVKNANGVAQIVRNMTNATD